MASRTGADRAAKLLFLVLYLLLLADTVRLYAAYGVGWDFIAHYLGGQSILSKAFLQAVHAIGSGVSVNYGIAADRNIYFEAYRAPLSTLAMAALALFLGNGAIAAYLAIVVTLFFVAVLVLSDSLNVDYVILASLMALPYIALLPMRFDSEEMLSLVLVMLALAFQARNKWYSGVFMGLACLSKYTALIFLPLLLLNADRKKIALRYAAVALVTLPWLLFNYAAFANPLFSYVSSIRVSLESSPQSLPSIVALYEMMVFLVPATALAAIAAFRNRGRIARLLASGEEHRRLALALAFLALAALEFIILGRHESAFDQARYGYFLYASAAILLSVAICAAVKAEPSRRGQRVYRYVLFAFSAASLLGLFIIIGTPALGAGYLSNNPAFAKGAGALRSLGLGNCSVVSNDWVYLRYYGSSAFSPFSSNSSLARYPSIIFNGVGVNSSAVALVGIENKYAYSNFTVYVPRNNSC